VSGDPYETYMRFGRVDDKIESREWILGDRCRVRII
jgi:hypothetical protein